MNDVDPIGQLLTAARTVAVVGCSAKPERDSHRVAAYLQRAGGYRMIPVNPGLAGQTLLGEHVFRSLGEIDEPIDMVDIFRNSDAAGPITDEALALSPLPQVIWMQLTVFNQAAAERAESAGVKVVMDRCPKMEYGKLSGEWGWMGGNSGRISSKRGSITGDRVQSLGIGGNIK